jgi:hypothetical protein
MHVSGCVCILVSDCPRPLSIVLREVGQCVGNNVSLQLLRRAGPSASQPVALSIIIAIVHSLKQPSIKSAHTRIHT